MVKILNAFSENEIHRVVNEDSKYVTFFAREGQPENLGKIAKNRETYCYAN